MRILSRVMVILGSVAVMGLASGMPSVTGVPVAPGNNGSITRSPDTSSERIAKVPRKKFERHFRVNKKEVAKAVVANGVSRRTGKLEIQMWKGRKPHSITFDLKQTIQKGDGEATLTVNDTTAGVTSVFTIDNETGVSTLGTGSTRTTFKVNPDSTLSVNATVHKDPASAAKAITSIAGLKPITLESYAAVQEVLMEANPNLAKDSGILDFVIDISVEVILWVIDITTESCGCRTNDSPWVWEWSCPNCQ